MAPEMKVSTRLNLGFAAVIALIAIVGAYVAYRVNNIDEKLRMIVDDRLPKLEYLHEVTDDVNKIARAQRTALLASDPALVANQLEVITKSREQITEIYQKLQQTIYTDAGKRLLQDVLEKRKAYAATLDEYLLVFRDGRKADATALLLGKTRTAQHAYMTAIDDLKKNQAESMAQAKADALAEVASVIKALAIAVVCAILIGLFVARRISTALRQQLGGEPGTASTLAQRIAAGDLSSTVELQAGDQSSMMYSMKCMQDGLATLVEEIQTVVNAGANGDFTKRVELAGKQGFGEDIGRALNRLNADLLRQIGGNPAEAVRVAREIAAGNLNVDIVLRSDDRDSILAAMSTMLTVLSGVIEEVRQVVDAASSGDFSQQMDADSKAGFAHTLASLLNRLGEVAGNALEDISRVSQRLAAGDLSCSIDKTYPGLFGQTAEGINATASNLRQLIGNVVAAVETINTASQEISSGNRDLSERTEEQASNLEETAASMEQFTSMVRQNTDNAKNADVLARRATEVAQRGGEVVKATVATMAQIQQSSQRIGDIISVIDGIAFQTNILALNAAVEAARAGEQGKGFAVVATEVRSLAQRSAQAAKEISGLISDSVEKVERGTREAQDAGETMQEVVQAITQVSQIVAGISHASLEQSAGIQQASNAILQMDETTQRNASLVEEAAAAAEALAQQSEELQQQVASFKLDERAGGQTRSPRVLAAPRPGLSLQKSAPDDAWDTF